MKRRIAIIVTTFVAVVGFAAGQHATADPVAADNASGTWACATVRHVAGTCINNPFEPYDDRGLVGTILGK